MTQEFVEDDDRYSAVEVQPAQQRRPTVEDVHPTARPADNRVPDNVRQTADRQAAQQAQKSEATGEGRDVVVLYNGERFDFNSDALTFEFQLNAEQGRIATALRQLLGEEQFKTILKWPLRHHQGLTTAIGKAAGLGNS